MGGKADWVTCYESPKKTVKNTTISDGTLHAYETLGSQRYIPVTALKRITSLETDPLPIEAAATTLSLDLIQAPVEFTSLAIFVATTVMLSSISVPKAAIFRVASQLKI